MHVVFLMDHDDGHKKGKAYMVEPTLGRRLCDNGVTIPYVTHMKNLEVDKEAAAKARNKLASKKEKEKKERVDRLLKEKAKKDTADSKKFGSRSKAVNL